MQMAQLSALERRLVDERKQVLIMRMFKDDTLPIEEGLGVGPYISWYRSGFTLEEILEYGVRFHGPAVVIGDPVEQLPRPGAAREYATSKEWKTVVGKLIDDSRLLVYVVGGSEHLKWELEVGVATAGAGAILLVIPPVAEGALIERWQTFKEFGRTAIGIELPTSLSYSGRDSLVILFASGEPIVVVSKDRSGWSYLLATRVAATLSAQRPVSTQQAGNMVNSQLPMLVLSRTEQDGVIVSTMAALGERHQPVQACRESVIGMSVSKSITASSITLSTSAASLIEAHQRRYLKFTSRARLDAKRCSCRCVCGERQV